jgi:ParB/RepB/Spo0J family partition protein
MRKQHKIATISLVEIKRPREGDRIDISKEKLAELAQNIKEVGLLQDPLLRKADDGYEIVFGDRRILAVRILGWEEVQVKLCDLSDVETAEVRGAENLLREDLTVIEEAKVYLNLKENYGRTIDQIAERFGIGGGTVKRRLDLLKMDPTLQNAMHAKAITYGVAEALAPIADKTALDYYLGFAIDHGVTVTIARQWCSDWKASMRRREAEDDPAGALTSPVIHQPTYLACDLCHGAEEVQNLTHLRVCKECAGRLAGAMREEEQPCKTRYTRQEPPT